MAQVSPLRQRHEEIGAAMLHFGAPADGENADSDAPAGADVVETFGSLEAEYAAIRKGCALIDLPHRGAVRVTGGERLDFLNRMLTQELRPAKTPLPPFRNVRTFWLNRKGRIDADLRLTQLPDDATAGDDPSTGSGFTPTGMYFDTDIMAAPGVVRTLTEFVFAEDIELTDVSESTHRFALHGPAAARLLADNSTPDPTHPDAPRVGELADGQSTLVRIADRPVLIDREDQTGEIGMHLLCARHDATAVFDALAQHARDDFGHHNDPATDTYKLRHAGWAAFNVARIEAGTPLFRIDFSTTNLPAESGMLQHRVSFTKGCYLGQEVVARMQSLGHPKQVLAGLKIESPEAMAERTGSELRGGEDLQARLPQTGSAVFAADDDRADAPPDAATAKPVGGVTSATPSPMLGGTPIAFAQLKWGKHQPGTELWVQTPAGLAKASVHEGLRFWAR